MAQRGLERTVQQSVLDRLIDTEPDSGVDAPRTHAQSVRDLKRAVRRDLEWLLNTRRTIVPVASELREVARSVFTYGLPDISSLGAESIDSRDWLRRQIESAIALFEPRLTGVSVSFGEAAESGRRELRFVVDAVLQMDPNPEQVTFDTVFEVSSAKFEVAGSGDA
jgi:type VI secretion system protein ImpF